MGILLDEPADIYYRRERGTANYSGLKIIHEYSLAHYAHYCESPDKETPVKVFGKAAHVALLEPAEFGDRYRVLPADAPRDLRYLRNAKKPSDETKAAIDWWDAWDSDGRISLEAADYSLILDTSRSLRALEMSFPGVTINCGELIDASQKEVTLRWVDEETGLPCKARIDIYHPDLNFAFDPKFCVSASPRKFSAAITNLYYHLQHATYCEAFRACGAPLKVFGFLPVEKEAPHVAASYYVDAPSEERGYAIFRSAMNKLARAMQENRWPGYTTTLTPISIAAWGHYDAEERAQ